MKRIGTAAFLLALGLTAGAVSARTGSVAYMVISATLSGATIGFLAGWNSGATAEQRIISKPVRTLFGGQV